MEKAKEFDDSKRCFLERPWPRLKPERSPSMTAPISSPSCERIGLDDGNGGGLLASALGAGPSPRREELSSGDGGSSPPKRRSASLPSSAVRLGLKKEPGEELVDVAICPPVDVALAATSASASAAAKAQAGVSIIGLCSSILLPVLPGLIMLAGRRLRGERLKLRVELAGDGPGWNDVAPVGGTDAVGRE